MAGRPETGKVPGGRDGLRATQWLAGSDVQGEPLGSTFLDEIALEMARSGAPLWLDRPSGTTVPT
jgi:hypothetical protein